MNRLWKAVNNLDISKESKNRVFLSVLTVVCMIAGCIIWVVIGRHFLAGVAWLFCFMGYPGVFIGIMGGTMYLYKHEFKS
ncbi:hypothetical protein [Butyrivibrio sp. AC2005]|uniref:hypothetical protein n=1 Tax=Butyrivibrio sp. AC2005 TaxID=1280672 RepID=UPI00040F79DB|nr:hypothetical protein [Butyrivibrio sp. AC2005]